MSQEPSARRIAYDALRRIESHGAYANLVMRTALGSGALSDSDRRFATDLVYGTTRMRRACDALVDRFIAVPPDEGTRTLLRLGAYQLMYARIPPHAAVSETVALAPKRTQGFVNAVLRKLSAAGTSMRWPSDAARLSYPDWLAARLVAELGPDDANAVMVRMNEPPPVTQRDDGYVQDLSSQWVAAAVEARAGERVLDMCAAPGGKTTVLAAVGARVVATDIRPARLALVVENVARLGHAASMVVADGAAPPFRAGGFDAVLIDAPCSGLGALRRRADARWRVEPADVDALAALQRRLLVAGAALVGPSGRLVYSVCTLTAQESVAHEIPDGFDVDATVPDGTWRAYRHGWRVLPHDADTDGMVMIRYRRRV